MTESEARTPLNVRTLPSALRDREAFIAALMDRWNDFESWPVEEQARERKRICSTILLPRLTPKETAEVLWAVMALWARGVDAGEHLVRAASGEIEFLRREAEIRKRAGNPTFEGVLAVPAGEGPGFLGDAPSLSRGCRALSAARTWGVHRKKKHDEVERLLGRALLGRPRRGLHPSLYTSQFAAVKEISALLRKTDALIKRLTERAAEELLRKMVWAYWKRKAKPERLDRKRDFDRWTSHLPLRALGVDGDDTMRGMIGTAHLVQLASTARRWPPFRQQKHGAVEWDLVAFAEQRGKWTPVSLESRERFQRVLRDERHAWTNVGVSVRRRRGAGRPQYSSPPFRRS